MPQPRSAKRARARRARGPRRGAPEEEFDDESSNGPNGLNIDIADDRVIIELPRDGNERPALEAIGAMLESMSWIFGPGGGDARRARALARVRSRPAACGG